MKTLGQRLSYLISTQNVSMLKFCDTHNLKYSSINPICNDKREIGMNIINDLVKIFPNLNINWLVYGTGSVNYTIYDEINSPLMIKEPDLFYYKDEFETLLLSYLEKKTIRKKVLEIANDGKK
jgi:hypothetical protein